MPPPPDAAVPGPWRSGSVLARFDRHDALAALGVGIAYLAAGKLGLSLAFVNASASAVWPPTGIALAAFLLLGRRVWPGVFAAAFLVNVTTAGTVATSLAVATGNTLEGLVGAWLVTRYARGTRAFETAQDLSKFAVLAGVVATTVSATIGVTSLALGGFVPWPAYGAVWTTWWLGDAVGALVVCPAIVLWSRRAPRLQPAQVLEGALLLASLALVGLAVFGGTFGGLQGYPIEFVTVPFLVWAAFRLGPRAGSGAVLVLSAVAVWGTLRGNGPFVRPDPGESLVLLQAFMGVVSVMTLALGAVVAERRRIEDALRAARDELEQRVKERTASLTRAVEALRAEVAERRRVEEDLRREEALLAEAEQIAHLGSWEWDLAADKVAWSRELCRIHGLAPGEAPRGYQGFLERVHPDDRAGLAAAVERALRERTPFEFEHRIVRPDGAERWALGRGRVVSDGAGNPARLAGTLQDVTERKLAEEQRRGAEDRLRGLERLQEMDRFKTDLLNTAAHELSTPLTPIKLQLELLREMHPEGMSPDQLRSIEILQRNVDRMTHLVSDILEAARLQAGRLQVKRVPMDLDALVREGVESFQEPARRAGLALDFRGMAGLEAEADPARLHQVLLNLLGNALKFTPEGGRVDVEVAREDGQAVVRVRDTGVGLRSADFPRLFQPFSQLPQEGARATRGTGLGLYICRGIVEQHGGRIWAESAGPGKGSTFAFALPLTREAPPVEAHFIGVKR